MSTNREMRIAGQQTVEQWLKLRQKLVVGGTPDLWRQAFESYFLARVSLRYLDPIALLQKNSGMSGVGFSIVAIQCTLVEFLEATLRGVTYRFLRRGDILGEHEYSKSGELFTAFLSTRYPFAEYFDTVLARDFYVGVRCALLHEARTKDWLIWAYDPTGRLIDREERKLFRDEFQKALLAFIGWYGEQLPTNPAYQIALIYKIDSLCT